MSRGKAGKTGRKILVGMGILSLGISSLCGCGTPENKENTKKEKLEANEYVSQAIVDTAEEEIGFPGADGFGKETTGGRGGKVYEVTNLNDSGEGSLRAACEAEGPRIVVFKVSGTINLESSLTIKNGNITIAGQTAPGDGICLANYGLIISKTENVIVRYLRSRPGSAGAALAVVNGTEKPEPDAIWVQAGKNIILDHCSTSWAVDETLSVSPAGEGDSYENVSDNVSVQWCMISESLKQASYIGTRHGMGSLIRGAQGSKITFHHNLYFTHSSRMPMCGNYVDNARDDGNYNFEFINNVVYNWSGRNSGKCADADSEGELLYTTNINYINNVFKAGPYSEDNYAFSEACMGNHMYIAGNMMNGKVPENQKDLVFFEEDVKESDKNPYYAKSGKVLDPESYFLSEPFKFSKMSGTQDAKDVEEAVLASVGASLHRDCVDTAVVDAYKEGKGKYINNPAESVGWNGPELSEDCLDKSSKESAQRYFDFFQNNYPKLESLSGYVDSDKDGMSDAWEEAMGLDPKDASDGAKTFKNTKHTNLDVFLQYLIENPSESSAK